MKITFEGTPHDVLTFIMNLRDGYNDEVLDSISNDVATLLKNTPDPLKMWQELEKRNDRTRDRNRKAE